MTSWLDSTHVAVAPTASMSRRESAMTVLMRSAVHAEARNSKLKDWLISSERTYFAIAEAGETHASATSIRSGPNSSRTFRHCL